MSGQKCFPNLDSHRLGRLKRPPFDVEGNRPTWYRANDFLGAGKQLRIRVNQARVGLAGLGGACGPDGL